METRTSSGIGAGFTLVAVALLFVLGPMVASNYMQLDQLTRVILVGFGVLLLVVGAIVITVTRLYHKTSANMAFVRTGWGGSKPIIDGGALVIPVVHNQVVVSLETIRLDVEREGAEALITGDNLRADVKAEFYIKVQKKAEDVLAAATSLGERSTRPDSLKQLVFQKLVSALRTVAGTKPLKELHSNRKDFASAVQEIVKTDLEPNGLTLESVTISKLDQTPPNAMRADDNVFDAQGLRTIAEIVAAQKVERNRIQRDAEQTIKQQDVENRKRILDLDLEAESAAAEQAAKVAQAKAEAEQRAATVQAEQRRLAETARVESEKAVSVTEVEKTRAVEVAERQKQQAVEVATVQKQQAVEVAIREQQVAVAEAEKRRAEKEAEQLAAEKNREAADQAVKTVQVKASAERDREQTVIRQQAEAEKKRIDQEVEANVAAYKVEKAAEAERKAAQLRAEALRIEAEANKESRKLEAEGEQAYQMVPVEVERQRVQVKDAEVEVERKGLEYKAANQTISRDLQIELARIAADRDARIEAAKAFGTALSKANITMWSDPAALARMSESFLRGQQTGRFVNGLTSGLSPELLLIATGIIKKVTGQDVSIEALKKAADEVVASDGAKADQ